MAADNFQAALDFVLKYEGGFSDNKNDPGGATNRGVTQATLSAWRGHHVTINDVQSLTLDEASEIYRKQYWNLINGDQLPVGVDLAVLDYAVNSGVSRAIKALQAAVNIDQDGHLGLQTMDKVSQYHPEAIIDKICARRLSFLENLKAWRFFGKGWGARVAACRFLAIKMAAEHDAPR